MIRSFLYDPRSDRGAAALFATIVTKDYPGSGTSSKLDRPGVFRTADMQAADSVISYARGRS